MVEKVPVTASGYTALNDELKDLKSVQRPEVIRAIAEAREHGDLSENAEYHSAREKQSFIEGRIKELEGLISRADVIDPAKLTGSSIKFGATVTVADDETRQAMKWLYDHHGLRTEPSGVVTVAALMQGRITCDGEGDIVAVISGRNADEDQFRKWIDV